jgi:hypothetical protein
MKNGIQILSTGFFILFASVSFGQLQEMKLEPIKKIDAPISNMRVKSHESAQPSFKKGSIVISPERAIQIRELKTVPAKEK